MVTQNQSLDTESSSALEVNPFEPVMASEKASLLDMYHAHVDGHPKRLEFPKSVEVLPSLIFIADEFDPDEQWPEYLSKKKKKQFSTTDNLHESIDNFIRSRSPLFGDDDEYPAGVSPFTTKTHKQNYVQKIATALFFKRLADGDLCAMGVWEENLQAMMFTEIPPSWWTGRVTIDLKRAEIWEPETSGAFHGTRRWTRIEFRKADQPQPQKSGFSGRPTSMHLALAELGRRHSTGEMERSLAAESRYLSNWLRKAHPNFPQAKPGAVENSIRDTYWILHNTTFAPINS